MARNPRTASSGPAFRQARMEGRGESGPAVHTTHSVAAGQQGVGARPGPAPGQSPGGSAQQRAAGSSSPTKPFPTSATAQGGATGPGYGGLKKAGGSKSKAGPGTACPESKSGPGGIGLSGRGAPLT